MQAWICYQEGSTGMGADVSVAELIGYGYEFWSIYGAVYPGHEKPTERKHMDDQRTYHSHEDFTLFRKAENQRDLHKRGYNRVRLIHSHSLMVIVLDIKMLVLNMYSQWLQNEYKIYVKDLEYKIIQMDYWNKESICILDPTKKRI